MIKIVLFGIVIGMSMLSRMSFANHLCNQKEIQPGVNLKMLSPGDIKIQHNTLHIQLLVVQLLDFKLDVEQSRIYDVRRSLFLAPDSSLLHQDIQRQALEQTREAALKSGILATAEQNVVRMVKGLFSDLGYTVQVEVQPAT